MYAALWRALPGGTFAKMVQSLVLAAALVAFLFLWAFPAVAPRLPFNSNTITTPSPTSSIPTSQDSP